MGGNAGASNLLAVISLGGSDAALGLLLVDSKLAVFILENANASVVAHRWPLSPPKLNLSLLCLYRSSRTCFISRLCSFLNFPLTRYGLA